MIVLLFGLFQSCYARDYLVDSQRKFDAISGRKLQAGDAVLLRRGMQFTGMLAPRGQGTELKPIRIDAYGEGARPQIHAMGVQPAGLLLQNPSYWEINGLEITNTDGSDRDQGELFGIYVLATDVEGTYRHIYINDCYIHDVNGKVAGKRRGGIHVHIKRLKASIFDDVRITNNRIENVGGVGIGNDSSCGAVKLLKNSVESQYLWTRVYVADNYIDWTGRNNVIARVSKDAVYERNTLANSSRCDTGHSIFCFNTDGIKIQYNEAYGNVGDEGMDRGGFDADYNCVNTYIQYNYSHDNNWFCGIMKRPTRNVVIRYNVSQNDLEGIYFYGFEKEHEASDVHIYNNTHFVRRGLVVNVFPENRTPINTTFENNVFYFEGTGGWGKNAVGKNVVFRNNIYHNIAPHVSETMPIVEAPRFVDASEVGHDINLKTMNALRGYQLRDDSPGVDTATMIDQHGFQDILKNTVSSWRASIGAFEIRKNRSVSIK